MTGQERPTETLLDNYLGQSGTESDLRRRRTESLGRADAGLLATATVGLAALRRI